MFPKIVGFPPKSSILIGFSMKSTIHFGVFPYFWKHPCAWKTQDFPAPQRSQLRPWSPFSHALMAALKLIRLGGTSAKVSRWEKILPVGTPNDRNAHHRKSGWNIISYEIEVCWQTVFKENLFEHSGHLGCKAVVQNAWAGWKFSSRNSPTSYVHS